MATMLLGTLTTVVTWVPRWNYIRAIVGSIQHQPTNWPPSNWKPSVVAWLFALSFEMSKSGSRHRIHALFERALANGMLQSFVILWRCYIAYQIDVVGDMGVAKRIFFRAIHSCPSSKKLWLDGFLKLNSILSAKELADLQEVMHDKQLNLMTDIYEILLQDEYMDKVQI